MARIKLDGDASGLLAAQRKVREETKRGDDEFKKVFETNKALERQVRKTWEEARPALERYNDRVRRLTQLEKEGKISKEQLRMSLARLRAAYDRVDQKQTEAFGARAVGRLGGMLLALGGVQEAVQQVIRAFQDLRQEQQQMGDALRTEFQGRASLAMLATTDEEAEQLDRTRRRLRTRFGVTRQEAAPTTFALASAGFQDAPRAEELLGRATALGQGGKPLIDAVDTLQENLGTSADDILDAGAAASQATKTEVPQLIRAAAAVAKPASDIGLDVDEVMAGMSVLSRMAETPEVGRTQFQGFVNAVDKSEFDIAARTIPEIIENINRVVESGAAKDIREVIGGDISAMRGFRAFRDSTEEVDRLRGETRSARENNQYEQRLFRAERRNAQELEIRRQEAVNDIVREEEARAALNRQMRANQARTSAAGTGLFNELGVRMAVGAAETAGVDPAAIGGAEVAGQTMGSGGNVGLQAIGSMIPATQILREIADNTAPGPTTQRRPE